MQRRWPGSAKDAGRGSGRQFRSKVRPGCRSFGDTTLQWKLPFTPASRIFHTSGRVSPNRTSTELRPHFNVQRTIPMRNADRAAFSRRQ